MSDDDFTKHLSNGDSWLRALLIAVYALIFYVAACVLGLVVIVGVVMLLFTGKRQDNVSDFGHQIARYLGQIMQFATLRTEDRPFPFGDWPAQGGQSAPPPAPAAEVDEPATEAEAPADEARADSEPAPPPKKKTTRKKAAKKTAKKSTKKATRKKTGRKKASSKKASAKKTASRAAEPEVAAVEPAPVEAPADAPAASPEPPAEAGEAPTETNDGGGSDAPTEESSPKG